MAHLCSCDFDHLTPTSPPPPLTGPSPAPPLFPPSCRESKVQSEAQVPKVILAGRCSKSSAVTGTVVVGAIVRAEGQVGLGYVQQLTRRKYSGGRSSEET